jgi:hypothetical protein
VSDAGARAENMIIYGLLHEFSSTLKLASSEHHALVTETSGKVCLFAKDYINQA